MTSDVSGTSISQGAHLILGPAGTGKTSLLCERYVELATRGEEGLLLLVHSRRTARALNDRLLASVGRSTDRVRVSTWHAFALSLLRQYHRVLGYKREPGLLTAPEQFTLVRDMLDSPAEQAHWGSFRKHLRLSGFVEELREFVLRAQDALESPEQLVERARLARRPDLEEAARFFRRYLREIDQQQLVDHANAIALAVRLLEEHDDVAREVHAATRHLFVDDYHDVTPAQEALLRALFVEGGSVHLAANEDARVFGFRGGSASGALERYRTAFRPVHEVELSESRRGGASREAWRFDHLIEEADAIARECLAVHVRDGVPYGEIAVLLRRFGPTARAIRRALERVDVPYVVVGENRPLADEPALVPMLEVARAALLPDGYDDDRLPRLLTSPVVGLDAYDVRALRREARLRGSTLGEVVRSVPDDLPDRHRTALRALRDLLDEVRARNEAAERPDEVSWFLWERLDYFRDMVARNDAADLDAVAAFATAVERFSDRRPGHRFADYLRALDGVEFGPEPWRVPEERRPDAVRILTAHQAVGAEFEIVFVAGCVEGEFPDPRDRRAMLDIRDLLSPATSLERRQARLAEERRLFGVATTRARRRLVLTCARESSQREPLNPTPFLSLVCDAWGTPPAVQPLTREDAEAAWRRIARDTARADAERLQAVEMLARLPGVDPSRWWYEREWTDTGRPLHEGEFRTSYSRLSPYEDCPLRYLYASELGLDPEQTHHMLVGSWIHGIVERCSLGEIPAERDALLAELDRVWNPDAFPDLAREHRARVTCEEMLDRWLKAESGVRPLAVEVEFSFPLDGAILRGYIDRVVRIGGSSTRIIDYKTGQSSKGEQEVKEDLQLATYYLATRRAPELQQLGEPMRLELAYLARPAREGFWRPGFDPRRIDGYEEAAEQRLRSLIDGVKSERFAPKPDADCMWCKFKTLCPVWAEGAEVPL